MNEGCGVETGNADSRQGMQFRHGERGLEEVYASRNVVAVVTSFLER